MVESIMVPSKRFPEFHTEWKKNTLSSLCAFLDHKRIPLSSDERKVRQGTYPYYGASGIIDFVDDFIFDGDFILLGEDGANIVMRNSPLAFMAKGKFWVNNHAHVLEAFGSQYFLCQSLERLRFDKYNTGTAQPKLNAQVCKSIILDYPSLPEQQKIAAFLSAVDTKIQQLQRKKELLELYKNGVMQKIFSQEIRFKDENGQDYPDWEEKKIKQFVLSSKGSMKIGPFGSQLKRSTFVDSGYKVYGQENIFIDDFDYGDRFITESHFNSLKSNEIIAGDFVISTMGTIGKSSVVPLGIQRGIMDSHMIRLQLDVSIISTDFLAQLFISYAIQKQIKRFSVGGIMDGLSMGIINELRLWVPSIDEQNKIAQTLSILDVGIENIQNQLSFMKQFKKGLLQQMFV
jgi:type I restriction enzyme, S subunit